MAKKAQVPQQQSLTSPDDPQNTLQAEPFGDDERDLSEHPSSKEERQELFIPVSGFVWLYPEEIRVIDHPTFQRLGRIYQLGQAYTVYRGATHKRLEHALGTLSVVKKSFMRLLWDRM